MNKRILALLLAMIMILGSVSTAFAADFDLIHKIDSNKDHSFMNFMNKVPVYNEVTGDFENYLIKYNDNSYNVTEVNASMEAGADDFIEAIEGLEPVEPVEPEIPDVDPTAEYTVVIEPKNSEYTVGIEADGGNNTTLWVKLIDGNGEVVQVNNLQVNLETTYGTLSDSRVTLQKGIAHTTLNTEFLQKETQVKVQGQVIEGTVPNLYKEKIAEMSPHANLIFVPYTPEELKDMPNLVAAESNQADRVSLIFDRDVNYVDVEGAFAIVTQEYFDIDKGLDDIKIHSVEGFHQLEGNDEHIMEAILEVYREDGEGQLVDNKWVTVALVLTNDGTDVVESVTGILGANTSLDDIVEFLALEGVQFKLSFSRFKLTDARVPEFTAVDDQAEGQTKITAYFSESMFDAEFSVDGGTQDIDHVEWGEFDSASHSDERHIATIVMKERLEPGQHSLKVSSPKDWAYLTDTKNIGSTQTLLFDVLEEPDVPVDDRVPTAVVEIESPEQFRVNFIDVENSEPLDVKQDINMEKAIVLQMETEPGVWEEVMIKVGNPANYPNHAEQRYKGMLNLEEGNMLLINNEWVSANEILVETNTDWTWVFNTHGTVVTPATLENYYNNNFRLLIPAGAFKARLSGLANEEIILPLGNLGGPVDDSPVVEHTEFVDAQFGTHNIFLDRPVKGIDLEQDEVGETPSQLQHEASDGLPNIVVEYRGTDYNGIQRTISGTAIGYVSDDNTDSEIVVKANSDLQLLVDYECYDENWVLVVRNITDDIGNSVDTKAVPFVVEQNPTEEYSDVYKIRKAVLLDDPGEYELNVKYPLGFEESEDYDVIRVEYTDFIKYIGDNDEVATEKSNYKVNSGDLGSRSFILVDLDSYYDNSQGLDNCRLKEDGYLAVYIFIHKDAGLVQTASNILHINGELRSQDGDKLDPEYEVELDYNGFKGGLDLNN